jgi:plastocyanin
MKDVAFKPQYITARVGQTLVFANEDDVAHKIKGQEGQYYSSKSLSKGQTYEYKIKRDPQLKNMAFICTIHPEKMRGGVVVTK